MPRPVMADPGGPGIAGHRVHYRQVRGTDHKGQGHVIFVFVVKRILEILMRVYATHINWDIRSVLNKPAIS